MREIRPGQASSPSHLQDLGVGPSAVGEGHVLKVHSAHQVVRGQLPIVHHGWLPVNELEDLLGGPHSLHQATVDGAHGLRGRRRVPAPPTGHPWAPTLCQRDERGAERARTQSSSGGTGGCWRPPASAAASDDKEKLRTAAQMPAPFPEHTGSQRVAVTTPKSAPAQQGRCHCPPEGETEAQGSCTNQPQGCRTGIRPSSFSCHSIKKISLVKMALNLYSTFSLGKNIHNINANNEDSSY